MGHNNHRRHRYKSLKMKMKFYDRCFVCIQMINLVMFIMVYFWVLTQHLPRRIEENKILRYDKLIS
jgi:hypothetical protein